MNIKPFFKGVYYSARYVADECDNALCLCMPAAYNIEYQKQCYETARSLKEKAKENFRLAFKKDITNRFNS
jgi:hypothetical protein